MKTRLLNNLMLKCYLSSRSNLKPILKKKFDQTFWHFHDSIHFKDSTFRNESHQKNGDNEMILKKQLSDSILNNPKHGISEINNKLHHFSLSTKLYILDALVIIQGMGHKNTINYFDCLRPQIIFEVKKLDIYELMQLLYFSSIIKTENTDDYSFMNSKIIERIEDLLLCDDTTLCELCPTDIAVLCHSLFRLKIKFKTIAILSTFSSLVVQQIETFRLHRSHVLSIVKYMRFNEYSDQNIIQAIKAFIKVNFNKFTFTECAHYLAFFANVSVYETNVYRYLADERASHLLEVDSIHLKNGEKLRSKDLERFLWSVSITNHKLTENLLTFIFKHMQSLMTSDYLNYPHFLLSCLKSLIIIGIYPENILLDSLNSQKFIKLFKESKREKVALDLYFILESIAIERPSIKLEKRTLLYSISKEPNSKIAFERRERPQLLKYRDLINRNQKVVKFNAEFSYILPHIRVASILINGISLELIDRTVKLYNSSQMNGLMRTKLRQMDKKQIPYKLIHNSEDIKHFLKTNDN